MKIYVIKINETDTMSIEDVNIRNNDELQAIDKDIVNQSIQDFRIEKESDIQSFCDGCDLVNSYYSKQTAEEEFDSYMNLSKAEKEDQETINLHGELI